MYLHKTLVYKLKSHLKEPDNHYSPPSLHHANDSVAPPAYLVMGQSDNLHRNYSWLQEGNT